MFVVLPPHTSDGSVVFGKNAVRPISEVQEVIHLLAKDHPQEAILKCTYLEIDQVPHTHAVILSKPAWCWGAEMGANEHGVCAGKEAVWTKLNSSQDLTEKLLGLDLLRLALERSKSAREAVDVITSLLSKYGHGGACSEEAGLTSWAHHCSFLIIDNTEAWALETAGTDWAAEKLSDGSRYMGNELTIHTRIDLMSEGLVDKAKTMGLYVEENGKFDFSRTFSAVENKDMAAAADSGVPIVGRSDQGQKILEDYVTKGKFGQKQMCEILREQEGVISLSGAFISTASQISILTPPTSDIPGCHWLTATPNPCISFFKPFLFCPGAHIGNNTKSPDFGKDDPAKLEPRFENEVDRRHPLYRVHEKFCALLEREDPKGQMLLGNVHELEEKCFEDVEEILRNFDDEKSIICMSQIFAHMSSIEMNFYN